MPVYSSVCAEPLAVCKTLCNLDMRAKHVIMHTDHQPLVWSAAHGYSLQPYYNRAIALAKSFEMTGSCVEFRFVAGANNPADALSRGHPPVLMVTKIGELEMRMLRG